MLDDLSPMSNINLSNFRLEGEFVNIIKLINETIDFYTSQIVKKKIEIIFNPNENLDIKTNKSVVNFILLNLFFNAIKYSEIGGAIEINYKLFNNSLELSVKDSGAGMTPEKISQILTTKNKLTVEDVNSENDSELGLNLCHQFIVQNNGNMEIESEIGKGSKITATIPVYF